MSASKVNMGDLAHLKELLKGSSPMVKSNTFPPVAAQSAMARSRISMPDEYWEKFSLSQASTR
jgi:hypothetical protein